MSNVATNETFEAKMKTRIKESIGDLITDEELSKLINAQIKVIFLDRRVEDNGYSQVKHKPPLLEEIIKECLTDNVKDLVKSYINDNSTEIQVTVKTVVQEGVGVAFMKALSNSFSGDMHSMEQNILNKLRNSQY